MKEYIVNYTCKSNNNKHLISNAENRRLAIQSSLDLKTNDYYSVKLEDTCFYIRTSRAPDEILALFSSYLNKEDTFIISELTKMSDSFQEHIITELALHALEKGN